LFGICKQAPERVEAEALSAAADEIDAGKEGFENIAATGLVFEDTLAKFTVKLFKAVANANKVGCQVIRETDNFADALNGGGVGQNLNAAIADICDLAVDPIPFSEQRFEAASGIRFGFFSETDDLLYDDGESALGSNGAGSVESCKETNRSGGGAGQFVAFLMCAGRKTAHKVTFGEPVGSVRLRSLRQVFPASAEIVEFFSEAFEEDSGREDRLRLQQKNLKKRSDSRCFLAGDETPVGLGSQTAVSREWLCCLHRWETPG
jgi:hypothetical protein